MCDASSEDIDELIEYELRDCIEIEEAHSNDIFYQQNEEDYEVVEHLEDEVEEDENVQLDDYKNSMDLDVKSATPTKDNLPTIEPYEIKSETEDTLDETTVQDEQQEVENQNEFVIPDKDVVSFSSNSNSPSHLSIESKMDVTKKVSVDGPLRYMLFDELVACVVDHDADGAPIVEFSISGSDADEKLPVECGICPDVMHKSKLAKHLKTHLVPGTKRYQCIYCEETYKDCKYLAGHARRHMGIRPYVCELCKLYFSTKQDLRVHNQRRHQEKEHICEMCGKTFAQNTQLKRHRESTHEKKRRFKCEHCPKSYYKNFSLQEHIRAVHMGKRRMIVCPFCGMQCRDAHKMARHRKQMHLNQSHYECHICHEEFTDINYFDAHKRSIQCRNNTRRKIEEEALMLQQQLEQEGQEQYDDLIMMPEEQEHEQVQILEESEDVKPILIEAVGQEDFINQKIIQMLPPPEEHDVGEQQEELVYEITIDSSNGN